MTQFVHNLPDRKLSSRDKRLQLDNLNVTDSIDTDTGKQRSTTTALIIKIKSKLFTV